MNSLILKDQSGKITDPHILDHIHTTLKLKIGDEVRCTVLNIGLTKGKVLEINNDFCQLGLSSITSGMPQWFDLIVGISRPQTTKKILEHATTFGANKFHFFQAALSEKSYLTSKVFENNSYEEYLQLGLSQSAIYTNMPKVKTDTFNPASQYKDAPQKFVLDLKTDKSFSDIYLDFTQSITLAVGPERGFINDDLDRFHQAGFTSVKISSSILRVEHAIYSAISQLELLRKRF